MTPDLLAFSKFAGGVMAIVGAVLLIAVLIGLAARARRSVGGATKEPTPDIPKAMKPGPADPDLESKNLEKLKAAGLVVTLFLAVWLPVTWLNDPNSNLSQEKALHAASIERGKHAVQLFSETNPGGVGCVRCHGVDLSGGHNLFAPPGSKDQAIVQVPNLQTVCGGASTGHANIKSLADIQNTIMQGREGTDMPSWSIRFKGPLDDQQIGDLVNYIVEINKKTIPFDQNVCINPKAGSPTPAPSASSSASPGAGASASPGAAGASASAEATPSGQASP
jgi:mono/diheme cytochrome c family protein